MNKNQEKFKSTREAYGEALVKIGKENEKIVVLDAETSNSTYAQNFKQVFPDRFFEMFIAEQNMVSVALGFDKMGFIPFVSTFSAFLTRAFDQIRMAQYSNANLKIAGSHCGVSIGADGPSQMGLEDLSMMRSVLESVVFYPSDYYSTKKLVEIMAENYGMFYIRLTREKTPLIYDEDFSFEIGGSVVHRLEFSKKFKKKALVITAGITLFEALKAQEELAETDIDLVVLDCYSVKPLDEKTILSLTKETKNVIVVEDHYPYGGLGEAASQLIVKNKIPLENFSHLCVSKIPMSGKPEDLLAYMGIDRKMITKKVLSFF
jgi:Transketolase, C-terminal subunit